MFRSVFEFVLGVGMSTKQPDPKARRRSPPVHRSARTPHRTRVKGSAWDDSGSRFGLIDSMILPQVHLRNGELTALRCPVSRATRLYLKPALTN